jgi:hypothetical protein
MGVEHRRRFAGHYLDFSHAAVHTGPGNHCRVHQTLTRVRVSLSHGPLDPRDNAQIERGIFRFGRLNMVAITHMEPEHMSASGRQFSVKTDRLGVEDPPWSDPFSLRPVRKHRCGL